MKTLKFAILSFLALLAFGVGGFLEAADAGVISLAVGGLFASRKAFNKETINNLRNANIYTGENDIDLDFSGGNANSFLNEMLNTTEFQFQIKNNNAAVKKILLCPAYFDTRGFVTEEVTIGEEEYTFITGLNEFNVAAVKARGIDVDAMIGTGTVATDIICSSNSAGSIEDFLRFCRTNPTRIPEIVLSSDKVAQYSLKFVVKRVNPGRVFGEQYIGLQRFFETSQYRDEKIVVDTARHNLQFDDQTLCYLEVAPNATVDLTFKLGASKNMASALYNKAERAFRGIGKMFAK